MKTPIDAASAGAGATTALLNGGAQFAMLDLWKLTLNGGAVVRWHGGPMTTPIGFAAAAGQPTAANGSYVAGPVIDRGKVSTKLGLEVAALDMKIAANSADQINGAPLIPFANGRGFDGASVVLYRAFLPDWASPITGLVIAFSGRVTEIKDMSRAGFTMTVSAWTVLLNVNMGPDVFQAGCLNTHYNPDCGLVEAAFTFGGSVQASPAPAAASFSTASAAIVANGDHYYDKGKVTFASGPSGGANAGLSRTVQSYVGGLFTFAFGFPNPPAPGDVFDAVRGCLLTLDDCKAQRTPADAEAHFRGQPFTPPAVQAIA